MLRRSAIYVALALLFAGLPTLATQPVAAGSGVPAFTIHRGPAALDGAGEPTLGVNWATGAVMFQDFADTWRVTFDQTGQATWTNVRPPNSIINLDPILFTDSSVGRTYAGGLDGACSILASSDDDGATWQPMGNACAATFDHETIGSGPWIAGERPDMATYDRAVYYCAQFGNVQCSLSQDGGLTFGAGFLVSCETTEPGLHGSVHVAPNGHVWLPFRNASSHVCISRSTDHGVTWTGFRLGRSPNGGFDADIATGTGGWLYVGHSDENRGARVSLTKDDGATWTRSPDLGAAYGLVATTFYEMVAGDDDRAALAFLGTTAAGHPYDCSFTGDWHLYASFTWDGGATWSTQRITDDPVQRGGIWDRGGSIPCRNLLDFMDAQVDREGNVLIGFADGCVDACARPGGTVAQSRSDWGTIARQTSGRGLFAEFDDGVAADPPSAPILMAGARDGIVNLTWTKPFDGGSAIRSYHLYRDGALLATVDRTVQAYADAGVENGVQYVYEASAQNAAGEGPRSLAIAITPRVTTDPPTACFGTAVTDLTVVVDGSCSSDPDGAVTGWTWGWGDGSAHGHGSTASHTYAVGGQYEITLVAMDDNGATAQTSLVVTVAEPGGDPDPATPTLANGQVVNATNGPNGAFRYWKIFVPQGSAQLETITDGPGCTVICINAANVDIYVRQGEKPTTTQFDCASRNNLADERCVVTAPGPGWWFIGIHSVSGNTGQPYTLQSRHT